MAYLIGLSLFFAIGGAMVGAIVTMAMVGV